MKNNAYIQAIKRQKFARFAEQFAKFAAAFGLAANRKNGYKSQYKNYKFFHNKSSFN